MAARRSFFLWDLLLHARGCPWCGCGDIHPSTHPLRLLSVLRCETWRCHRCARRFPLRPGQEELPVVVPKERPRRPAGAELHSLDRTLAELLRPGPLDGPELSEFPRLPPALERPRRKSDGSS
jgi:hypothetical protein